MKLYAIGHQWFRVFHSAKKRWRDNPALMRFLTELWRLGGVHSIKGEGGKKRFPGGCVVTEGSTTAALKQLAYFWSGDPDGYDSYESVSLLFDFDCDSRAGASRLFGDSTIVSPRLLLLAR